MGEKASIKHGKPSDEIDILKKNKNVKNVRLDMAQVLEALAVLAEGRSTSIPSTYVVIHNHQ